jgi:hypothetical protein
MILRDKYGWPVELIIGRPVLNVFRRILVTSWRQTWKRRNAVDVPDGNSVGCYAPNPGAKP